MKKIKAFTLAEALVVIVIIGVIAAVALPILNKTYQEKTMYSALKKNYYVIKTALERYEVDNFHKITSLDGNNVRLKIKPYLNITQDCEPSDSGNNYCGKATHYKIHLGTEFYNESYRFYQHGQLALSDGSLLMFGRSQTNPNGDLLVYVDVNGYKKEPNQFGYDTFVLKLDSNGVLKPMGEENSDFPASKYCTKGAAGWFSSFGCAYKIIMQDKI